MTRFAIALALLLAACSPVGTGPTPEPSQSPQDAPSASATSTVAPSATSSLIPPATGSPRPEHTPIPAPGWYIVGQLAWPVDDIWVFDVAYCLVDIWNWDEVREFCDGDPRTEEIDAPVAVVTDRDTWMKFELGMEWPFAVQPNGGVTAPD